jgi:hypothetical protein
MTIELSTGTSLLLLFLPSHLQCEDLSLQKNTALVAGEAL